ncbi:MAG: hypothetical protein ISR44_00985 [Rhodospirillales bacterium]|nr:hypothetical protein [Rhodospirillales bacterium]
MFTRSAIFEGVIHPGKEDAFFDIIENSLLPIWRRMPNVTDVRLFRPVAQDDGTPDIILVQQIDYPTRAAIDEALSSHIRDEAVAASEPLGDLYDGRHYHFVYEKLTT